MEAWPITFELSSWDGALVVQMWIIYKMVVGEKEIARANVRIALVFFMGPALLMNMLLRVALNFFQGV